MISTPTIIRWYQPSDLGAMLALYAPFVRETAITFDLEVPSEKEFEKKINDLTTAYPVLVAVRSGTIAGYAYASQFRSKAAYQWSCESTIYLAPEAQGTGLGKIIYQALFDLLRLQGFHNVFAGVTLPNVASERLHLGMGFADIGIQDTVGYKFGQWHTTRWFQLKLAPNDAPGSLVLTEDLRITPEAAAVLSHANEMFAHLAASKLS